MLFNFKKFAAEAAAEAREELENTPKEAEDKPKPSTEINPEESVLPDTEAKSESNAKNSEDTTEKKSGDEGTVPHEVVKKSSDDSENANETEAVQEDKPTETVEEAVTEISTTGLTYHLY